MIAGGIILCGGRSSRMGTPKAWLPIGDELMLPRVVRLLSQAVAPIVVVAAPDQDVPPLPAGIVVVRDAVRDRGPLQGLEAGLKAMVGRVEAAYLTSCDAPLLRSAFVLRLIELLGDRSICIPEVGGRLHPLSAVYRIDVLAHVSRRLAEDRRRLVDLIEDVPTRVVEAHELADVDPTFESLRNVNTPEEYAALNLPC